MAQSFAFVFPGQGSQWVGMMGGFASLPVVKATFEEASAILGEDYWALSETGPAEAMPGHHKSQQQGKPEQGARRARLPQWLGIHVHPVLPGELALV